MRKVTIIIKGKVLTGSQIIRAFVIILFLFYVLLFLTLTLFNRGDFAFFKWNGDVFSNYINNSFNIIPFKTIRAYFKAVIKGNISINLFLYNIFGNLFALMPFALGLPIIFKKQNKFFIFLSTIFLMVVCIEVLQFVNLVGSFDVDDLILNVFGACVMYGILHIKPIKNVINKLK